MSNYRNLIMFLIAIVAAVGAVIVASQWLNQRSERVEKVAVAVQEINMGQKLTSNMFKLISWPAGNVPESSFSETDSLEGRVTKSSLQVGEPILESKLAPVGSMGGLSAVIAEGKRAITVRVNDVVGVAGFALPGNFVDIIVNTEKEEKEGKEIVRRSISKIVLEKILVLAVAQESARDETKPKVVNAVTLEVTPEQAEKIDLARSIGDLSLVLRNQSDLTELSTEGITKDELLEFKEEPKIKADNEKPIIVKKAVRRVAKPKKPTVQKECTKVITGLSESLECF